MRNFQAVRISSFGSCGWRSSSMVASGTCVVDVRSPLRKRIVLSGVRSSSETQHVTSETDEGYGHWDGGSSASGSMKSSARQRDVLTRW